MKSLKLFCLAESYPNWGGGKFKMLNRPIFKRNLAEKGKLGVCQEVGSMTFFL